MSRAKNKELHLKSNQFALIAAVHESEDNEITQRYSKTPPLLHIPLLNCTKRGESETPEARE